MLKSNGDKSMLGCVCGGILELLACLLASGIGAGGFWGTKFYNRKMYMAYKEKHKSCDCECHRND